MTSSVSNSEFPPNKRVASIDVLRGLTILVMIFVNDIAGVVSIPSWLKHIEPSDSNGMTFVDVVFPAFLFIVGMSIPLSLGKRLQSGTSLWRIEGQILLRTFGLLCIGLFMVNQETMGEPALVSKPVWTLLVYLGILLVWNQSWSVSKTGRRMDIARRCAGGLLLVALAFLYRGQGERSWMEMTPQWWGIIGLIGWSHLVASNVYLFVRNRVGGLVGGLALLGCLHFAARNGLLPNIWIFHYVDVASALASLPMIAVAGIVAGVVLSPGSSIMIPRKRIEWAVQYGGCLAMAGYLLNSLHALHPMFFINKISATVPWGLWCSAITIWVWALVYFLVDVKGWKRWTVAFSPAGENALFAYILGPILYAAVDLWDLTTGMPFYWSLGNQMSTGILRSLVLAFVVVGMTGALRRIGIQPKL